MTQLIDIPEKEIKITPNTICGDCLHSRDAHLEHYGHTMLCSCCNKLCDRDEFYKIHKATDMTTTFEIQSKREYSQYKPKEVKRID